jgi:hypothetical protein
MWMYSVNNDLIVAAGLWVAVTVETREILPISIAINSAALKL